MSVRPIFLNGLRGATLVAIRLSCLAVSLFAQASAPPASQTESQAIPQELQKEFDQIVAARAAPYRVQPGDELEIRAYAIPDLNLTVKVRPDGKTSVLLLEDIEAAGHTIGEITELLESQYSKFFRRPQITVILHSFYNFNVYVGGEVNKPGLISLAGGLTAASAVFEAGGFKEEEGPKRVILLRQSRGAQSVMNLDLDDVLVKGKADVALQPSDILYVPRNAFHVYVGGEVVEPGLVPLNVKMTALAAILRARGLKNTATAMHVILLRDSGQGKPIVLKVNLKDVIKGKGDPELRPYDVVYVPKSAIAKVDQFVDQYIKQLLPISTNLGFSYILRGTALIQ